MLRQPFTLGKIFRFEQKFVNLWRFCLLFFLGVKSIYPIISIVMNREEKEEEEDNPEEESIEESHKSPGSKTNRSDSLTFTPRANHRISRNNSQSSSLLNNRMSLVEATDTPRNLRNSTSGHPNNTTSASNTLKRGGTLNRPSNNQVLIYFKKN